MVTIENFDDALHYVHRLGFTVKSGFPGWIPQAQARMCNVTDKLWQGANKVYPYTVHYTRKDKVFTVNENVKVDARYL